MPLPDMIKKMGSSPSAGGSVNLKEKLDYFKRKVSVPVTPPAAAALPTPRRLPLRDVDPGPEDEVFLSSCSSLSKSLIEFLQDQNAMGYFVQYLEARDALNVIKFWMDVQGFKAVFMLKPTESTPAHSNHEVQAPLRVGTESTGSVDSGYDAHLPVGEPISQRDAVSGQGSSSATLEDDDTQFRASTKDAVDIYQRYIAPDCPLPIPLSTDIRQDIVQGICTGNGFTDFNCFQPAEKFICDLLERDFYGDFLRSDCHAKYQVDVLTSGHVRMNDILHDDTLLFHFMEFMDSIGDRDLLEFWMAANNFRHNHNSSEHLESDALVIYERFISMQASSPLGLSCALRSRIEESICSESGVLPTSFDPALIVVIQVLERNFLHRFLESSLYRKYLSELLAQIQTGPYAHPQSNKKKKHSLGAFRRRSGSNSSLSTTCSSSIDTSISAQNTLLASMSRSKSDSHGHVLKGLNHRNLSVDSLDPDNLWRRNHSGVRNIGEVDHLGRYTSRYEPLVENEEKMATMSSKLGRAMKRLVHSDIDKMKEEMAWQMAEMIIKDILDVTSPELRGWHTNGFAGESLIDDDTTTPSNDTTTTDGQDSIKRPQDDPS